MAAGGKYLCRSRPLGFIDKRCLPIPVSTSVDKLLPCSGPAGVIRGREETAHSTTANPLANHYRSHELLCAMNSNTNTDP